MLFLGGSMHGKSLPISENTCSWQDPELETVTIDTETYYRKEMVVFGKSLKVMVISGLNDDSTFKLVFNHFGWYERNSRKPTADGTEFLAWTPKYGVEAMRITHRGLERFTKSANVYFNFYFWRPVTETYFPQYWKEIDREGEWRNWLSEEAIKGLRYFEFEKEP